jgi:hypothetical protein
MTNRDKKKSTFLVSTSFSFFEPRAQPENKEMSNQMKMSCRKVNIHSYLAARCNTKTFSNAAETIGNANEQADKP